VPKREREEVIVAVHLAGTISQGEAIDTVSAGELVPLPAELMLDRGDQLFRAGSDIADLGIMAGDFLVVEPRKAGNARTGEAIIVIARGVALAGRWWRKHGRRALMDSQLSPIAEGKEMRVFGAITLILRHSRQTRRSTWRISTTSAQSPAQLTVNSFEDHQPSRPAPRSRIRR
jgi:SOS-response transcriptional repressor LexA